MSVRLRSRFNSFLSLTFAEQAVLCQAWLLILLARVVLPLAPLPRFTKAIARWVKPRPRNDTVSAVRLAQLVEIAGRRHRRSTCLERSLALLVLLRRRDQFARLAIGIRKDETASEDFAHAWVELPSRQGSVPRLAGHPADGLFTRLEVEL